MKHFEFTMKVVEDRSAPMMLTEKNLPGACCCSCCCCFSINGDAGSANTGLPAELSSTPTLGTAGSGSLGVKQSVVL